MADTVVPTEAHISLVWTAYHSQTAGCDFDAVAPTHVVARQNALKSNASWGCPPSV